MKHLKLFNEGQKFINDEERKLFNFSNRLEYAINKYFNVDKSNYSHTSVWYVYNHIGEEDEFGYKYKVDSKYPIGFCFNRSNLDSKKVQVFEEELDRLQVKHNKCYDLTMKQAEEFLRELKINFMTITASKYNL